MRYPITLNGYVELPDQPAPPQEPEPPVDEQPPVEPEPEPEPEPGPDPEPPVTEWLTWDSPPQTMVPDASHLKVGPGMDAENVWALHSMNVNENTKLALFGGTDPTQPLWHRGLNTQDLRGCGTFMMGFGPVRPVIRSVTEYPLSPAEIAAGMTPEKVESFWEAVVWQVGGGTFEDINCLGGPRRRQGQALGFVRAYKPNHDWIVQRCGFRDCWGGPYSSGGMKKMVMRQLDIDGHAKHWKSHGLYLPGNRETETLIEACTFRMGLGEGNHIHVKSPDGNLYRSVVIRNCRTTERNSKTSGFLRAENVPVLTLEGNHMIADLGNRAICRIDYRAPFSPKPMHLLRVVDNTYDAGGLGDAFPWRLFAPDFATIAETVESSGNELIGFDPERALHYADGSPAGKFLPLPGHALAA